MKGKIKAVILKTIFYNKNYKITVHLPSLFRNLPCSINNLYFMTNKITMM